MHEGDAIHAKQVQELYAQAKAAQETAAALREKNLALEEELRKFRVESEDTGTELEMLRSKAASQASQLDAMTAQHRERLAGVEGYNPNPNPNCTGRGSSRWSKAALAPYTPYLTPHPRWQASW